MYFKTSLVVNPNQFHFLFIKMIFSGNDSVQAVFNARDEVVAFLLYLDVDKVSVNCKASDGRTALHYVCQLCHFSPLCVSVYCSTGLIYSFSIYIYVYN